MPRILGLRIVPADDLVAEHPQIEPGERVGGGSIYGLLAARGHPVSHGGANMALASADEELAAALGGWHPGH